MEKKKNNVSKHLKKLKVKIPSKKQEEKKTDSQDQKAETLAPKQEGNQSQESEQKIEDFKETILSEDISFVAPVIREIEEPTKIETLEQTATDFQTPGVAQGEERTNNLIYDTGRNDSNYSASSTYGPTSTTGSSYEPNNANITLDRRERISSTDQTRNRDGWGTDNQELDSFARMQEQYRTTREEELKTKTKRG